MKCKNCGAQIKEGKMFCSVCGNEIRIVPDYNDLEEEMLNEILEEDNYEKRKSLSTNNQFGKNQHQASNIHREPSVTRHAPEKKKNRIQKLILFWTAVSILTVGIIIGIIYYNMTNSFTYFYNKAVSFENDKDYSNALYYYKKSLTKNESDLDARFSMADVYQLQHNDKQAISTLLNIISLDKSSKQAFKELISIYDSKKDYDSILSLYKEASTSGIKDLFSDYIVSKPVFDQDAGSYTGSLVLKIKSPDNVEIYYTLDGTDPKKNGTLYDKAISLSTEGDYQVNAVCKNVKGVYSNILSAEYDISTADTQQTVKDIQVTPDSGTYASPQSITITVPDGYKVYYTWDGSDPTISSSQYTQPLDMQTGNNILSLIYVDLDGTISDVSKYNYICN